MLGRHITRRSDDRSCCREVVSGHLPGRISKGLGDAEIEHFHRVDTVDPGDHDIIGLDIAMQNGLRVCGAQGVERLFEHFDDELGLLRPVVFDDLKEVSTFDELEDHEEHAVVRPAVVEHLDRV